MELLFRFKCFIVDLRHITDRYFDEMRAQCAEEMWIWFRAKPECYLKNDADLKSFLKFFDDIVSIEKVINVSNKKI